MITRDTLADLKDNIRGEVGMVSWLHSRSGYIYRRTSSQ